MAIKPINTDAYLLGCGLMLNLWRNEYTNYIKLYFEGFLPWDEAGLTYLRLVNSIKRLEKKKLIKDDKSVDRDTFRCPYARFKLTPKGIKWLKAKLNRHIKIKLVWEGVDYTDELISCVDKLVKQLEE